MRSLDDKDIMSSEESRFLKTIREDSNEDYESAEGLEDADDNLVREERD